MSAEATPIHVGRQLKFSTGTHRTTNRVQNVTMTWFDLVRRLKEPVRTNETYSEYRKMSKDDAAEVKDVGYFVGGHFKLGRRKKGNILHRDFISLDIDHAPIDYGFDFDLGIGGYTWCMYSTHSNHPDNPRLRLVIPLTREIKAEEYEPIARYLADRVGINYFDSTTYEVSRAMYWPSVSWDADYLFEVNDGEWVNPDQILATYKDWRDTSQWVLSDKEKQAPILAQKNASNPLEKSGPVGAFCRAYSISAAIEKFIPDIYSAAKQANRYTYNESTTTSGAVAYGDLFLYSHHESDPVSRHLVNAFDLVRIHKFGDLDDAVRSDTKINNLPSFKAMLEFLDKDEATRRELIKETVEGFDDVDKVPDWLLLLETDTKGNIKPKITNIKIIVENDEQLKGAIAYNEMSSSIVKKRNTPWGACEDLINGDFWEDVDDIRLRLYIESRYNVEIANVKAFDVVRSVAQDNTYHPVRNYLNSLEWDSKPRIETLLHRHLGVERNAYTDAVSRKVMCAAVARVFNPGCKFDYVLILEGVQGKGKSSFISKLAVNPEWFGDSVHSFNGKEAIEGMQGQWLVELPELQAFGKSEIEQIKAFISRQKDKARMAYGRHVKVFPRQSIFIGTTNDAEYLKDDTGNRRFWPVYCKKEVIDFEAVVQERDQLWAEAVHIWRQGEKLYLDDSNSESIAKVEQLERLADDGMKGVIEEWLNLPVSPHHYSSSIDHDFIPGELTEIRTKVCVREIWIECLGGSERDLTRSKSVQIGQIMRSLKGWKLANKTIHFGKRYGKQKGYISG